MACPLHRWQCRSHHCQQQLQRGGWSVRDADKENQWQGWEKTSKPTQKAA